MSLPVTLEDIASAEQLTELVRRVNSLVLTVTDEAVIPRTSPVFFVFDQENSTAYWLSNKDSTHSKNIEENGKVSAAFVSAKSNGRSPALTTDSGMQAVSGIVEVGDEREFAYKLLKQKARKLPETLEDLEQYGALRTLYKAVLTDGALLDAEANNAQYMVLGTAPKGQPHVLSAPFTVESSTDIRLASEFPLVAQSNRAVHVCIFDADVPQGDGVGVYFDAALVKDNGSPILQVATDASGSPILTTNGLFQYQGRTGWVDAQASTSSNVLMNSM